MEETATGSDKKSMKDATELYGTPHLMARKEKKNRQMRWKDMDRKLGKRDNLGVKREEF